MSSSKVTIKEVAKMAGVSIATVSRYINKSLHLREENRRKIEKAIKELDYRPLVYARRLAGGRLNTFGLIIPGYQGIFYSFYALKIIREVAAALDEKEIDMHLNIYRDRDIFNSSLVDGVIMADLIDNKDQLLRLKKEGTPLVVINRKLSDEDINFVAVDNHKGAYEATEFLIDHGHKNIVHLAGDTEVQCACQRIDGFKAALKKNGIKERPNSVCLTNFSRARAREELDKLFSSKEFPTAIFCCSDEVASEVLNFADENSIEIPEQLSVIGFDDNPNISFQNMMLTTVRQPLTRMAKEAVKILKQNIDKELPSQKVILEPKLVIRDTVGFQK
ncbi:MAG: LacI family transcriptional regulator [Candidatus Omnitrophica bacterium]|nr:LacI family transcriptional regulator [Candidatus Omnitrophota bacterium]MCF7891615.1 LacI family transcriptional regulator [Candidatus Omnitrophota bacterium]MCF7895672.1 LacI family transcriptional regulator [Candidatus Omnitrophota bacterium]MCF7897567.1 LacI family transcriptional regulator [Candidatus Omnitrophota bacterium]